MDDIVLGNGAKVDMTRRKFLRDTASALPLVYAAGGQLLPVRAAEPQPDREFTYPGVIVRQSKPENFEFPFPTLNSFATPNNLFYVRTHFGIYKGADLATWRLKIEGRVERPLELRYDDLLKMPSRTQVALLECA